jgi:hypothetical protein
MKAIKLANSSTERARLKEKCLAILAKAEEIKKIEQWQPQTGHPSTVRTPSEITRVPQSRRQLSTREEVILLEGSKLHGLIFPPWKSEPDEQEFTASTGEIYTCVPRPHYVTSHLTLLQRPVKNQYIKYSC